MVSSLIKFCEYGRRYVAVGFQLSNKEKVHEEIEDLFSVRISRKKFSLLLRQRAYQDTIFCKVDGFAFSRICGPPSPEIQNEILFS